MEAQVIFDILFALAGAMAGFILRAIWSSLDAMRRDVADLQKSLPETYVRRDDYSAQSARIEAALIRIEEKIDNKVDKR